MNKKKLFPIFLLFLAIMGVLSACEKTIEAESSVLKEETSESIEQIVEISENTVTVDYLAGWNYDQEGYVLIRMGKSLANGTVTALENRFYVTGDANYGIRWIQNMSNYMLEPSEEVSGVLIEKDGKLLFYPYEKKNGNFLFICPKDITNRSLLDNKRSLALPSGETLEVQPIEFSLKTNDGFLKESGNGGGYYDASIDFSSIYFYSTAQGEDVDVYDTNAIGTIKNMDCIQINSTL